MQSKRFSLIESLSNTAIGFTVAFTSQLIIFPQFGFNPPISTNIEIALYFTVISIVRGYFVRRLFNHHTTKQLAQKQPTTYRVNGKDIFGNRRVYDFHVEAIECPNCHTQQAAVIEHTYPFAVYMHNCEVCEYPIMESEWQRVEGADQ